MLLFESSPSIVHSQVSATITKGTEYSPQPTTPTRTTTTATRSKRPRPRSFSSVRFDGVTAVWGTATATVAPQEEQSHRQEEEEVSPTWYSREDYARFKKTLIKEAKLLLKQSRINKDESSNDKKKNKKLATASNAIRHAYDAIASFQDDVDLSFHDCVEVIGLEHLVSKKIHKDKHHRRNLIWEAMDEIQFQNEHVSSQDLKLHANVMRRVCQEISAPSQQFALYVGMANESLVCC